MKQTTQNENQANDVLVMFPASKHFPVESKVEDRQEEVTPLSKLIEEFEEQQVQAKEKKPVMAIPSSEAISEIRGNRSCQMALEIRLKALEEIEQRLKFYLEDIGAAKRKI